MPSLLEGGCRVVSLREGEPSVSGGLRVWRHFGTHSGADAISLRVLEVGAGASPELWNPDCDEVFYVLEGQGVAALDGHVERVSADTGFYLRPGTRLRLDNWGRAPLLLASARCPDPGNDGVALPAPEPGSLIAPRHPKPFVRLDDRPTQHTGDRWYRVLVDESAGSSRVTQFVGAIPPGRAPDHHHEYEEVLVILAGRGQVWAGSSRAEVEAGSCVYLPRGQRHCVENTSDAELRLLGVFYPAGSPAVRYESDATRG
jgi:mannose-6-phosphate isomerase-like protein (cupin superfamily)